MPRPLAIGASADYRALHLGAVFVDRSARRRLTLEGDRCAEVLNGLVTNDVLSLAPGAGQFAMALTPKGKVIADLRVFRFGDHLLVDTGARAGEGLWAMVRKYVNPRLARYADVTGGLSEFGVFGPNAARVAAAATGGDAAALDALPSYAHLTASTEGVTTARVLDLGVLGYSMFVSAEGRAELRARLMAAGAIEASADTMECARIEAGRPAWGVDMDDSTLAQEANLEELGGVSFSKGCYTGQETVARLHFRGHVNRLLRAIRFDALSDVRAGAVLQAPDEGAAVGDVRSVAVSPSRGGVGIAMVRRTVVPGSALVARSDGVDIPVTVVTLPYQST
jgi:folate-binding protein YgfZ